MAQYHVAVYHRMEVKEHTLTGHGDTGELAALIAAGFCNEKYLCFGKTAGEVFFQVLPADGKAVFDFVIQIPVFPGVEYKFAFIGFEMV